MAQHAIEDLVEDTVFLIDSADLSKLTKRDYLAAVYRIQNLFDTGYTHFRVIDILLKYNFVYRIASNDYPGYANKAGARTGWIENEKTGELAYAELEEGQIYLYIDAGSTSWEKLCSEKILAGTDCKPVSAISLPQLIDSLLQEAEKQNQYILLTQWYGLLVNGYLGGSFGREDVLADNFTGLLQNPDLLSIRATAQRNQVKQLRNADESIALPLLADEVRLAGGIEKEFAARFFLDLKKSPEKLKAAYTKAIKVMSGAGKLIEDLIDGQLAEGLTVQGWTMIQNQEANAWHWYKDTPSGRRFLWIVLEKEDKFLMCHLGIQHRVLLDWQQRAANTRLADVHFYQMAIASLPESRLENKTIIHPYGGWKFDLKSPRKTLTAQIGNLIEDIRTAETNYFSSIEDEFPEDFFKRNPEQLLYLIEEGEEGTGIVPNYVLFDSPYTILLSFAFHYHKQGDSTKAASMLNIIREKLNSKSKLSAYDDRYLVPFLSAANESVFNLAMPPVYHYLLVQDLKVVSQI